MNRTRSLAMGMMLGSALSAVACGGPAGSVESAALATEEGQALRSGLGKWKRSKAEIVKPPRDADGGILYTHRAKASLDTEGQLRATKVEDPTGAVFELDELSLDVKKTIRKGSGVEVDSFDPEAPAPGTLMKWYPTNWDKRDCNGDGDDDWFIWDTDDRTVISSPSAPRQRTVVRITNTAGQCTGTVLRSGWVLTATHCTYTQSGAAAGSYSVRNWAGESVGVSLVFRGPGYSGSFDPEDDYTLLKLNGSFPSATGDMDISDISDSNINNVDDKFHNLGFPGRINSCNTINSTLVHTANNQVTGKNNRTIRWKGDSSGGHSGGPLYYCPGNDITECDSDDTGFVVAVVTGFSGYYNRNIGPRGAYFKDWATTIMDNN